MSIKTDLLPYLGQVIRELRLKADLVQTDFGDDNSSLSRLERGGQGIKMDRLQHIAAKLNVRVSQIWILAEERAEAGEAKLQPIDLRLKDEMKEAEERSRWLAATAALTESIILTTPNALLALREVLREMKLKAKNKNDREFLARLINRIGAEMRRNPEKSD